MDRYRFRSGTLTQRCDLLSHLLSRRFSQTAATVIARAPSQLPTPFGRYSDPNDPEDLMT